MATVEAPRHDDAIRPMGLFWCYSRNTLICTGSLTRRAAVAPRFRRAAVAPRLRRASAASRHALPSRRAAMASRRQALPVLVWGVLGGLKEKVASLLA
jgi:hypothetical protein